MNNPIVKLVLLGLLLMLLVAPFASFAPLMLVLLGLGLFWFVTSLVQAFFMADAEREDNQAGG